MFGASVAISNNTVAVGAKFADSGSEFNTGAVYIYERNEGGSNNWGQVKKLAPSGTEANDNFHNVAILEDTIVVGADQDDDQGSDSGAAYIFTRFGEFGQLWGLVRKITASDGTNGDRFGGSVSISNSTIIVGASKDNDNGVSSGSAYIYEKNTGGFNTWIEVNKLNSADSSADDSFGASIVIHGNTIIAGAPGGDVVESNQGVAYIFSLISTPFDFDGDGRADISVFRPSETFWYIFSSSTNQLSGFPFGLASDRLVPADYDGDRVTDVAVWREGTPSKFYILRSSDLTYQEETFGLLGDDPSAVGDWDGDGKADVAVYRDTDHKFYFRGTFNNPNNNISNRLWGATGDKTVRGDFDGDGKVDAAVFRPSNGVWYILRSSNSQVTADQFGLAEDIPVPADYDGDGKTDLAVYRPSIGAWYILQSRDGITAFQFGISTDIPVPADYDGDTKADAAVYRDGVWFILGSTSGTKIEVFGLSTDIPLPSVFTP